MKFKLGELRRMGPSLTRLSDKELPIGVSYRLSKFLTKVSSELVAVEKERVKLIQRFGNMDPDRQKIEVPPDKITDFRQAFDALLMEEVDIDVTPMETKELGDIVISPQDLMFLEKIISVSQE